MISRHLINQLVIGLVFSGVSLAAPAITGGPSTVTHGSSVTITGSDFESKTTAAPVVWDNCDHGQAVTARWSGAWPQASPQPNSTPRYALPSAINNVPTAHNRVSHYLAGRAYDSPSSGEGFPQDVLVYKAAASAPTFVYASWYQRVDPLYDAGDNFKYFGYSGGTSPYDSSGSWYIEHVGGSEGANHIKDNAAGLFEDPARCDGVTWGRDYLCNSHYFGGNPSPKVNWAKFEVLINVSSSDTAGWVDLYMDGVLRSSFAEMGNGPHSYNGATDQTISGSSRNIYIGGFTRTEAANNWRYFNDLYLDYTQARVMLGNASTLAASTVREPQIPTSWADGSITFTVNAGALANNSTAYIHVVNASGEVISTGRTVTITAEDSGEITCYPDADSDLYPGSGSESVESCSSGYYESSHFTAMTADCNDLSASIYPGATETCGDSVDQDCSGADLSCGAVGGGMRVGAGSMRVGTGSTRITPVQ